MFARSLAPLWEELNRRRTTVFIHPTVPHNYHPIIAQKYAPAPVLDFPHETTRTVGEFRLIRSPRRAVENYENRYPI